MRKIVANVLVCKRRQGARSAYRNWSPELGGGSVGCGHEQGRRPGSRECKRRVSGDARDHAGHDILNQRKGGRSKLTGINRRSSSVLRGFEVKCAQPGGGGSEESG